MAKVLLGLGANLGDVECTFLRAENYLASDIFFAKMSPVYWTDPVYDKPDAVIPDAPAPRYGNAVLCAETFLEPEDLLARCLEVERALGRVRPAPSCAPRPLDIDLLLYDDRIVVPGAPGSLELPHPRMHQRAFVLQPACDVAPDWVHPVLHKPLRELWRELNILSRQNV